MTVIYIPKREWINLSDVKQSLKGYNETNKNGKYDRAILKETAYYKFLLSELHVANDNEQVVVAA